MKILMYLIFIIVVFNMSSNTHDIEFKEDNIIFFVRGKCSVYPNIIGFEQAALYHNRDNPYDLRNINYIEGSYLKTLIDGFKIEISENTKKIMEGVKDKKKINLSGLIVRFSIFENENLENANLSGADFRGANFKGANLTNADLSGADVRGADFTGAILTGANLKDIKKGDMLVYNYCKNYEVEHYYSLKKGDNSRPGFYPKIERPMGDFDRQYGVISTKGLD